MSAWALAASVVTVLLTRADLEKAELRRGAARLVLNARENIVVVMGDGGMGAGGGGEDGRNEALGGYLRLFGAFRAKCWPVGSWAD